MGWPVREWAGLFVNGPVPEWAGRFANGPVPGQVNEYGNIPTFFILFFKYSLLVCTTLVVGIFLKETSLPGNRYIQLM